MKDSLLRLHHFEPLSRANGPGLRSVLWLQGCALQCPGCFNPQTHPADGGSLSTVAEIFRHIALQAAQIEGITVSGGEPLQQVDALLKLLQTVKRLTALSVILFTGYTWDEARRLPQSTALLAQVDVLLAGRYRAEQRVASGLLGSSNKTVHFLTGRYGPGDLDRVPPAEVLIGPDGELRFSGIEPLHW